MHTQSESWWPTDCHSQPGQKDHCHSQPPIPGQKDPFQASILLGYCSLLTFPNKVFSFHEFCIRGWCIVRKKQILTAKRRLIWRGWSATRILLEMNKILAEIHLGNALCPLNCHHLCLAVVENVRCLWQPISTWLYGFPMPVFLFWLGNYISKTIPPFMAHTLRVKRLNGNVLGQFKKWV